MTKSQKPKKQPFSFIRDGPTVEDLYCNQGMSVTAIAKLMGRGYPTILAYLKHKKLYTGAPKKGSRKQGNKAGLKQPAEHVSGKKYVCLTYKNLQVIFKHYYNDACLVYIPHPDYTHYAYCSKDQLLEYIQGE